MLTAKDVASHMGVSQRTLRALMEFEIIPHTRKVRRKAMFPSTAVADAIEWLNRRSHSFRCVGQAVVELGRLSSLRRGLLTQVLERIAHQNIELFRLEVATSNDVPVLFAYGVKQSDVLGKTFLRSGEELLGVRAAGKRLGVSTRMIPLLVRAGCLSTAQDVGPIAIPKCSILASSLERFRRQYRMSRELAAERGTSPKHIIAVARRLGLEPIVASNSSKGISAVWSAKDGNKLGRSK